MLDLLKLVGFRNFILAQFFSSIGNWVSRIAILTVVYSFNGSVIDMSIVSIIMMIPYIVLGPFVGNLIDRGNKKHILMLSDFIRAVIVIVIPFFKSKIFLLVLIYTVVSVVSKPTEQSLLPTMVPRDKIKQGNSMSTSLNSFMMILGPSLGGLIISILGVTYCYYFDGLTFMVSFFYILKIPYSNVKAEVPTDSKSKVKSKAIRYILNNRNIRNVIVINSLVGLAAGISNALLIVYVYKYIGSTSQGYGFILSSKGLFVLLTSLFIGKYSSKITTSLMFKIGLLGLGLSCTLFPLNTYLFLAMLIQGFNGVFNASYAIGRTTLLQEQCAHIYLGRVFSINSMLVNITSLLSLSIVGIFGELISVRLLLIVSGMIILFAGIFSVFTVFNSDNESFNKLENVS